MESIDDSKDIWIVFEYVKDGLPALAAISEMFGGFFNGERIYEIVQHNDCTRILENNDCKWFKYFVKQMLKTLEKFHEKGVVHADLKSENILISFNFEKQELEQIKVIDFGTSFMFVDLCDTIRLTTPEYSPPELLKLVMQQQNGTSIKNVNMHPWSMDTWSLGIIFLEILTGIPIYMSYRSRLTKRVASSNDIESTQIQLGMLAS